MLFGERPDLGAADQDRADRNSFTQQRYSERVSDPARWMIRLTSGNSSSASAIDVLDVNCLDVEHGAAGDRATADRLRFCRP